MQQVISAFPALCYAAAVTLGFLDVHQPFGSAALTPLLQWMLSLGLGLPSLWAALEIAGANVGIGLGAIAASVLGPEAAWAMTFMAAGFLWSAAAVHVADMVHRRNFAINNAAPSSGGTSSRR